MKSVKSMLCAATFVSLCAAVASAWADTQANPYRSIAERNPFAIKPAPPPPPPADPTPPAMPLAKVVLTGVINVFGPPRALLEITEQEPGKGPSISKRVLKEGERDGSIEVLSIDVVNNKVRIKNGSVETNVMFEVAKIGGPGPGAPGAPAVSPMASLSPPAPFTPPAAAPAAAAASPMIISRQGSDSQGRAGTGVSLAGASAAATPTGSSLAASSYAPSSLDNLYGANNRLAVNAGVSSYGVADPARTITRQVRTEDQPAKDPHQAAMNTYIGIETLRQAGVPLPETPLTKHLQQP